MKEPNPLLEIYNTPAFLEFLKQKEQSCDPAESPQDRLFALNGLYLDVFVVLILEALKDLLSHPSVHSLKLCHIPLCEENDNEMMVMFRFDVSLLAPSSQTVLVKQAGYEEVYAASPFSKADPLNQIWEEITPLLKNMCVACERIDPSTWNDFYMNYGLHQKIFGSVNDVLSVYEDLPHLRELKNQCEHIALARAMPQKPSPPPKIM